MLNVTLDKSTDPWTVDVDQHNNANEVSQSPNTQTITWQLTGNAAAGSFVSMTDPNPGFSWVSAPPSGIFGTPTISGNGNTMTMTDLNDSTSTAGTWTYIMRVNVGGTVYCTETTSITETNTDPTIKNH